MPRVSLARLALATLVVSGPSPLLAKRVGVEDALLKQEENTMACGPTTCTSFDAQSCSCVQFANSTELKNRLEFVLFELLQKLRYLSDKLEPDAGLFTKLWYGPSLRRAQHDLAMLEGALENVPDIARITETPMKVLGSVFVPPAGSWPVLVEVWDEGTLIPNSFLGEAGAPLTVGTNTYTLPLKANPNQHDRQAQGTVTFSTAVERSDPTPCTSLHMHCVTFKLRVKCLSAADLLNVDTGIGGDYTDPYCKVRVKQDAATRSHKDTTSVVKDSMNPTFATNEFAYSWEEPIIEPQPTNVLPVEAVPEESKFVPWVLDEMTPSEQAHANFFMLASTVFSDPKKCAEGKTSKVLCDAVEALGKGKLDKQTLDATAAQMGDHELAATVARAERLTGDAPDPKKVAGETPHGPAKGVLLQLQAIEKGELQLSYVPVGMAAVQSNWRAGHRMYGWQDDDGYAYNNGRDMWGRPTMPPAGDYSTEGTYVGLNGITQFHSDVHVHDHGDGVVSSTGTHMSWGVGNPNPGYPYRRHRFSAAGAILAVVIIALLALI